MKKSTDFIYLLRFIAAFLVVLKHYSPIRNTFINNGGEAVSFFFLLSGFILVVAYEKQIVQNNLNAIGFYVKRIARVYPLYLLALCLTLIYHFFIRNNHTNLPLKLPFELLMIQSWFYSGSINYPAWSISCELFFYLLFPFYILKLRDIKLQNAVLIVLLIFISIAAFSYLIDNSSFSFLRPDLKNGYLVQHPIIRIPVFFLGNVLGFMYIKNVKISFNQLFLTFLMGCICLYFWTFNPTEIGLSLKQLGLVLMYIVLIVGLLQNEAFSKKYLSHPFFILLGDISYGIYLLQFPVSSFIFLFINDFNPMSQFIIYLIVLLLLSYFVYEYFEKPFRTKIVAAYSRFSSSKNVISIQNTEGSIELKIKN